MHNNHYSPLLLLPNTFRAFYGAFAGLYPIQERAISPVLESRDLIIQSATGSGKTEAVLAPCLERIIRSGLTESVLYIVPTRALAFDVRALGITAMMMHPGWVQTDMGGSSAPLTMKESVQGMIQVIDGLSSQDAGRFLQWDGAELPW